MRPDTDDLLEQFRAGDRKAYATLWKRYEKPLRRFVRSHARGERASSLTDDLLQETHLAALENIDRFTWRRELSFFFWLCEIARRLIANLHRKSQRDIVLLARPLGGSTSRTGDVISALAQSGKGPIEIIANREHLDLLALGLAELIEKRREAVVLRYVEGLSNEEAARAAKVSAGAFRVTLSRALVDLRTAIDRLLGDDARVTS